MTIDTAAVHEIVTEIWESMLGLEISTVADDTTQSGREVYAAVQITGAWEGALIIECLEPTASAFTAAMLGMEDEEPAESDVHDVMGELANMAGGNLKAIVGSEARLSLPTVVVGADLDLSVPGASVAVRQAFLAGDSPFTVVIMAKAAPAIAAAG
ncbi:MAG: chemotaxis protein CheX [Acidimicrobiales bacterium]